MTRRIDKLAIAVAFHYVEARFTYLTRIASQFSSLASIVSVCIMTNAEDQARQSRIRGALAEGGFELRILAPTLLGHPYLLTWSHLAFLRQCLRDDQSVTHFMYLEDDICVRPENIAYWLEGRECLRQHGLIPSFLRYERKPDDDRLYSTDVTQRVAFETLPRVKVSEDYAYVNLPEPFQGMYLLDRELMDEHLSGPSSSPDFGPWGIREKAAQGLTFAKVPEGCLSRNFVGFDLKKRQIDPNCLIHHTPNNYAENPNTKYGKIPVRELVT